MNQCTRCGGTGDWPWGFRGYFCPACDHQVYVEWLERQMLLAAEGAAEARGCGKPLRAEAYEGTLRYFANRIKQLTKPDLR